MRFATSRRGTDVWVEGKRNNWIPRKDQGEVDEHIGKALGIRKVGDKIILRPGQRHYQTCQKAAPDLSGEKTALRSVAERIAAAVNDAILHQITALRQERSIQTPSPAAFIKHEVIQHLNR